MKIQTPDQRDAETARALVIADSRRQRDAEPVYATDPCEGCNHGGCACSDCANKPRYWGDEGE